MKLYLVYLLLISLLLTQKPEFKPSIDVLEISESLLLIRPDTKIGNPSTLIFHGKDAVLMVDAGLIASAKLIRKKLSELGYKNVNYILTTHYHRDHVEAIDEFNENALYITPKVQRDQLSKTNYISNKAKNLPKLTYTDSLTLFINNEVVEVFRPKYRKGHTGSDQFIYFKKANVLAVGDYLFQKFPIIDYTYGGGDIEGYFKNIHWLLKKFDKNTKIIAGHGSFKPAKVKFFSMEEYSNHVTNLEESIRLISNKIKAGKSLEEIVKEGLGSKLDRLGDKPRYMSTERWIKLIYNYYVK